MYSRAKRLVGGDAPCGLIPWHSSPHGGIDTARHTQCFGSHCVMGYGSQRKSTMGLYPTLPNPGGRTPRGATPRGQVTPRESYKLTPAERAELPRVPNFVPQYDCAVGYFRMADQNNVFLVEPDTPRVGDGDETVARTRKVPRALPKLMVRSVSYDSVTVSWIVPGTYLPNGVFLCCDDGQGGPFKVSTFWSPNDLAAHMRERATYPMEVTVTKLGAGITYRLALCEADEHGAPMLQPYQIERYGGLSNNTNIVEATTRAFATLPVSHRKLERWVPPKEYEQEKAHQEEEAQREAALSGRPRRFKDRFAAAHARKPQQTQPRIVDFQDHPHRPAARRRAKGVF